MNTPEVQAVLGMAAGTIGKDLLSALVQEIRMIPDVWVKLPKAKQDDIIGRLRARVDANVKMAVHLIASEGRTIITGDLDQVTIKNGVKAVVKFGANTENLHELYESSGKTVLIVVAEADAHTGGMHEIKGEADQRAMDLGHEYHDNDGGGMEGEEGGDGDAVDAEITGLPSPNDVSPTEEEKAQAWDDGYTAAQQGAPESDCPTTRGDIAVMWVKGWKAWHAENSSA
ncbi:MAG: cell division protein FtsK [Azoarcus sp.]|jgi:ribosome modulation factor|nr:cell division protein FtsK [Azoarcus sp.]